MTDYSNSSAVKDASQRNRKRRLSMRPKGRAKSAPNHQLTADRPRARTRDELSPPDLKDIRRI